MSPWRVAGACCIGLILAGCGGGAPATASASSTSAASASAGPAPPPVVLSLPSAVPTQHARLPEEHPEPMPVRAAACDRGAEFETLALEIADDPRFYWSGEDSVDLPGARAAAVVTKGFSAPETRTIYVRRSIADATRPTPGDLYLAGPEGKPGAHYRFVVPGGVKSCARRPELERNYFEAVARRFAAPRSAFAAFAEARLLQLAPDADGTGDGDYSADGLVLDAMGTMTGRDGIQAALHARYRSMSDGLRAPRRHSIAEAVPPRLVQVPFNELSAALPQAPIDEPLAQSVPADFYYLRARRLLPFLDALDAVESWVSPWRTTSTVSRRSASRSSDT